MDFVCASCNSTEFDEVHQYLRPDTAVPSWVPAELAEAGIVELASVVCRQGVHPLREDVPSLAETVLLMYVCSRCGWTLPVWPAALLAP